MDFLRYAWRLPAVGFGIAVATLLAAVPRVAEAQNLTLSTVGIQRKVPVRSDVVNRFKVSRSDCLADDVISFPLVVGNFGGSTLEVWATQATSDDCRSDTARTTASATCWRVFSAVPTSTTPTVSIRVQDFAAKPATTDGMDAGTPASCESMTSTGQPVTLFFMFLQGTTQVGDYAQWPTTVDLLGPSPPVVHGVGAGGTILKLSWDQNTDPDVFGYRVLCENLGSASGGFTTHEAGTPLPEASTKTTCPDAGSGTTDDDGGDASDDVGGASADACTPSTGGGSTGTTGGCGTVLVQGKTLTPDEIEQHTCGIAGLTSTSSTVTGLTNFERYAVAVTAIDLVENVGSLSTVQCAMPQPVNGFDEAYRTAGGSAGGESFCSIGLRSAAARATVGPSAAFLAIVAIGRRRRRSRREAGRTSK